MRMLEAGQRRPSGQNVISARTTRQEGRVGRCVVSLFLWLMLGAGSPLSPAAQAPLPPWATGQVQIVGTSLTVTPSSQVVPVNVATVVNTVYATGQGSVPSSYRVQGELSDTAGQVFNPPLLISARPNSPLLIPPLPVAGAYLLKNIRLMDGATALSSPAQVEIDASNVLVSSVTTRPMTEEEIRQSGIVINPLDYKAIRADIGLVLSSGTVHLDYPILVSVSDPTRPAIILSKLGVPGPPPLPNVLPPQWHNNLPDFGDLDLEPIVLTSDAPDFDLDIPSLNISGLLIFPSRITYLNQFFVAGLLLQNNAPGGSALQLKDMTAKISFPSLAPPFSAGNPLVLRQTSGPGGVSPLPLLTPINSGMQGTGEFDVTSPVPGTYAVQIDYKGFLTGLPTGQPVPVHGTARGVVVVKDPTFNVVFTHPSVVHQGQAYLLRATITNTSPDGTAANSVQLTLNPDSIHDGALLEEDATHHYPLDSFSLKVGESHTCEFLLRATRSGEVTAASVSIGGGGSGAISLVTGVGEGGIPLSPDTLIFPEVVDRELPPGVATVGLDLLGLGWSLATADPATRPAGMAPLSRGEVNSRANDMTTVARYREIGGGAAYSLQNALTELALKWQGNGGSASLSFDALRRLTSKPPDDGISRGQAFANVLGSYLVLPQQNVSDAHNTFAVGASVLAPHFSVALDPGEASPAPHFWIEDSEGRRLGEDGSATGLLRDIPWGESYPFGIGRLLAVGKLDGPPQFTIHLEGSAPGTLSLSVVAPGGSGLGQYLFTDVPMAAGSTARIVLDTQTTVPVLENDLDGDGIFESRISATLHPIQVPVFEALGAFRDPMADQTGRVVAVLFSKPVDKATAETASNYQLPPRTVIGAYLQPDGRIVEVRVQSRLSPLVPYTLSILGVKGQNQVDSYAGQVTLFPSPNPSPGGTVSGVVYGEDGGPLPSVVVYLSEYDKDLLKVQRDGLDEPDVFHTTQVTTTDASGTFNFDYVMMTGRNFGVEAVDPVSNASAKLSPIINAANQHMDVALFMRARGTVRGRILVSNPNGSPAAGALVTATSTSTGEFGQVFTDELGLYEIKKIPVDTISVVANAAGGLQAQAITRIDRGGDVATVNLTLADRATGGVQGVVKIVRGSDKTPAAGAIIGLDNGSPFYSIVTSAYADSQGNFLITGVPIGHYGLVVFDPVTLVKKIRLGVDITDSVYGAGEIDLVDAEGGLGTVTGHFYYPNLDPVSQALIYIASGGGGVVSQARTNAEGFFSLTNVPLGQWTVTAVDPVSKRTAIGQATISYDGQAYGLELYLPAVGQVHGIVSRVKSGGATEVVDGALVYFLGRPTTTHDGGQYEFNDVPAMGEARPVIAHVGIAPNDYVGRVYARVAYAGDVERADVTLMGRGDLTVHVLVKGSNSPAMALVNLFTWVINPEDYSLDQTVLSRTTPPDGTVTFPNVLATNVGATAADGFDGMGGAGCVVQAGVTTELTVYLSHSGTVSGVILGPNGLTPIPHAIVTLSQQGMPDRFLSAGDQGTYSFAMVPPGFVTVSAQDPQNGRKGYASDKLATPAANPVLNLNVRIPGAGGIQGVVLEDDGQGGAVPAANAQVLLKGVPPLTDRTATADALGQFYWDNVTEGTYTLQALDPYHPFPLAGRTSVTVERDRTAEVTVRLGDFGTVTGTLTWVHADNTVQLVANAQMTLSMGGGPQQQLAYTVTDSEGNFTFNYVPAGINFSVDAYDAQTGRTGNAANQRVEKNATLTLALQLSPLGTVQGPVTDQNGGVPSASVSTRIPGAGTVTTTAGSDGFYALPGLPAAHYDLTAVNPGNGAQATGDTGTQMFTHDGDVIEVPLAMPLTGSVTGNVFRSDGTTPVVGAVVTLDGSRQRGSVEGGHFEFQGVSLGSHTILASDPGSPDGGRAQVTVSATEPPVDAPIRFVGLGTVSGTVQYDSNPVMGFRVWLRVDNAYTGSDTLGPVGTDASGNFSFHQVRAGHITATVAAPAGSPDPRGGSQAGDLQPDGILPLNFALSPVAAVRGSLVGLDGQPVSGALVILTAQQPAGSWTTGTDATGNFAFPVIPLDPGTATNQVSWIVTGPFGGHTRGSGSVPQNGLYLSGLVLDTVIPNIIATTPLNGTDEISKTPVLSATFNKALDPATVNSSTVRLTLASGGGVITGTVDMDTSDPNHPVITFTPAEALASQTDYLFTLAHAIGDTSGNTLPADVVVQFKTLDDVPPAVKTVSPANGAVEVPQGIVLRIFFDEEIGLAPGMVCITDGTTPICGTPDHSPLDHTLISFQPPTLLAPNTRYTVTISGVEDKHHNVMADAGFYFDTPDTLPPVIVITGAVDQGLYDHAVTPIVSVTDPHLNPQAQIITLDGHPFVSGTTVNEEGTHTLAVSASDTMGHVAQTTITFAVDTSPPVIAITGLVEGTVYTTGPTPVITVTDPHLVAGGALVTLNGQPFVSGTQVTQSGFHTLQVDASDTLGHTTSATVHFSVGTRPPEITLTGPAEVEIGTPLAFSISGTDEVGLSSLSYTVSGAFTTSGGENYSVGTLSATLPVSLNVPSNTQDNGTIQIEAVATNVSAQSTPATPLLITAYHVPTVQITAPADGAHLPMRAKANAAATVGTFNGAASVSFLLDGIVVATTPAAPPTSAYQAQVTLPAGQATCTLQATATTGSGRSAASSVRTIHLVSSSRLSGQVYLSDGLTPAAGAQISLVSAYVYQKTVFADANGAYDTDFMPLSTYTILAQKADGTDGVKTNVTLSNDGVEVTQDLTFAGTGTVNGRVVDGVTGSALPGARVVLIGASILPQNLETTTAGDGTFTFSGVLVGSFNLNVYHPSNSLLGAAITSQISSRGVTATFDPIRCYSDAAFVLAVSPADGATEVVPATPVTIIFSQPVRSAGLDNQITVKYRDLPFGPFYTTTAQCQLSTDGKTVTALYPQRWEHAEFQYNVSGVVAVTGRPVIPRQFSFKTVTPPLPLAVIFLDKNTGEIIKTTLPPDDSLEIPAAVKIQVTFDRDLVLPTDPSQVLWLSASPDIYGSVTVLADQRTLEFIPSQDLPLDSLYHLYLSGLSDLRGYTWWGLNLTDIYTTDTQAPTVQILAPYDGAKVLDGAAGVPVRFIAKDGANYCGNTRTQVTLNGASQYDWTGPSCGEERTITVSLPQGSQSDVITGTATDVAGRTSTTSASLNPVAWTMGAETPYPSGQVWNAQLEIWGDRAYIFDSDNRRVGVYSLDAVGVSAPQFLGALDLPLYPRQVKAATNRLYVRYDDNLSVYDVTTPSAPALLGQVTVPSCGSGCGLGQFDLWGGHAFVMDWNGTLHILSIEDPNAATEVASLPASGFALEGGLLVVGLSLYDVHNPQSPILLPDKIPNDFSSNDYWIDGGILYRRHSGGITLISLADPLHPALLGSAPVAYWQSGGARLGDFLFCNSLDTVNVKDSARPFASGYLPLPNTMVARAGSALAVASYNGLRLFRPDLHFQGSALTITSPADGTSVNAGSLLTVTAQAEGAYQGPMDLSVNGTLTESLSGPPYSFVFWVPSTATGTLTLQVSLQADDGATVTSPPVTVTISSVDITPPQAAIYEPGPGSYVVGGDAVLHYSATDNVGVLSTALFADGQPVTTTSIDGQHAVIEALHRPFGSTLALQLTAWDAAGNAGSSASIPVHALFDVSETQVSLPFSDYLNTDGLLPATRERIAFSGQTTRLFDRQNLSAPILESACSTTKVLLNGDLAVGLSEYGETCFTPMADGSAGGLLILPGKDVATDGSLAAVVTDVGFQLYDLRTPESPALLAEVDMSALVPGAPNRLWLSGPFLLVNLASGEMSDLALYDISDPAHPVFRQSATVENYNYSLFLGETVVLGGEIFDLTATDPLVPIGTSVQFYGDALRALGDRFLLENSALYDLTQPATPLLLYQSGRLECATQYTGWSLSGFGGSDLLRVRSEDDGSWTLDQVALTILDSTPPTAEITSPAADAVVNTASGWWSLKADVSDNVAVEWVDVFVNGIKLQRKTFGPWAFVLPVNTDLVGTTFTVEVRAKDLSGNMATDSRTVAFGTEMVGVHLHPSGETSVPAGGSLSLTCDAIMVGGVDQVVFIVNGAPYFTATQRPFQCRVVTDFVQAGHDVQVEAIAYHGTDMISTADSRGGLIVHVINPTPNQVLDQIPLPDVRYWMALSPDGSLAALDGDTNLRVVSTQDWSTIFTLPNVGELGFLPDGNGLVTMAWEGSSPIFSVISTQDGSMLRSFTYAGGSASWQDISSDGRSVVFLDNNLKLVLLDLSTMTPALCCDLPAQVTGANWWYEGPFCLPGGRQLALVAHLYDGAGGYSADFLTFDLTTNLWSSPLPLPEDMSAYPSPDGQEIWFRGSAGNLHVLNVATSNVTTFNNFPWTGGWGQVVFHPGGQECSRTDYDASQIFGLAISSRMLLPDHTVQVSHLGCFAYEPHGRWGYVLSGNASGTQTTLYRLFVSHTDTWPPRLRATIPAEGGVSPPTGPLTCYLSEPMNTQTINDATVTVKNDQNQLVPGVIQSAHAGTVVTWTPNPALTAGTYILTLDGLLDESANPLAPKTLTFSVQ